jgi:hypothetical protein
MNFTGSLQCCEYRLAEREIIINDSAGSIRAVTHYGIEAEDIETVICASTEFSEQFHSK